VRSRIHTVLGAPILVDGRPWGVMMAALTREQELPPGSEFRLFGFTELVGTAIANAQARDDLRGLTDEQAALRRVATLVGRGVSTPEVFASVVEEAGLLLGVDVVNMVRNESDDTAVVVASWSAAGATIPLGTRLSLGGPSIMGAVSRSGRTARIDSYAEVPGAVTYAVPGVDVEAGVGAPILVDGRVWGTIVVLATTAGALPVATEARLAGFTELVAAAISNSEARDGLRGLADEQAALRRVATLVAGEATPEEVFAAVAEEVARIVDVPLVELSRYVSEDEVTVVAVRGDLPFPPGSTWPLDGPMISTRVLRTGAPARVDDYSKVGGTMTRLARELNFEVKAGVGVPVVVEGQLWGVMMVLTTDPEPLPEETEARLTRFTELLATAVANATARSDLIASRARIVAAGDEARRRIERNLHDGAQQRLVAVGLDLQTLRAHVPEESGAAVERIAADLEAVLEDVRELSRGLHPALLAQGGLGPALRTLGRNTPIPVDVAIDVDRRPPESVEIAVYYVVAEALTNVAKHATASRASVRVSATDTVLRATVEDDGAGGAQTGAGSGLIGLVDRVEALGGRFALESPPGQGTTIVIELPFESGRDVAAVPTERGARNRGLVAQTRLARLADPATLLEAVSAAADALYVVDEEGRISFLNPAAVRILGYDDDRELLGRPSHATIHHTRPDGTPFPASECPLLRPRVTGETVRVEEDWFVRRDGSLVPVAYSSAPLALSGGRGAVVSFRQRPPDDEGGTPLSPP
jgi:PAS domain S-box-containing protein